MIPDEFLRMLRCPATRGPLHVAESSLVDRLNSSISDGRLVNELGELINEPLDGGLVNEDGSLLYAIRDDIPCLLVDEAVPLAQIEGEKA